MFMGFIEEDPKKARAAYENLQAAEKSEAKRIENEAQFLYWSFRWGDVTAQERLHDLEEKAAQFPDALAEVRRWEAFCFDLAGDKRRAITRFREAAAAAQTSRLRAQNLRSAAATLTECDSRREAESLLITSLGETNDSDAKAELYLGLADLYKATSAEARALMLEKALQHRPMEKETEFAAAYAYSNAEMNGLAVAHYEQTLTISSKQDTATNNLGVALSELKLPALAFKKYERSIELGGTLAASNLALRYIEAGALTEAEAVLTEARKKEDVHQNVFSTSTRVENVKTEERERREKIEAVAQKRQRFLVKYADAMLRRDEWVFPVGEWKLMTGKECSIKLEGSKLEATWTEEQQGAGVLKEKYRFEGKLQGRVASGSIEIFKRNYFDFKNPNAGTFTKYGKGHAYFDDRKLAVAGTNTGEDEFKLLEFACKEVPTVSP
jgi:Tfp pilus assembly protein PilF